MWSGPFHKVAAEHSKQSGAPRGYARVGQAQPIYLKTWTVAEPDCSRGTIMYRRGLLITLAAVSVLVTTGACAGTSSGTITFKGSVTTPASASVAIYSSNQAGLTGDKSIQSVRDARAALSIDLLDYFAMYAPSNAKLVSVAYQ